MKITIVTKTQLEISAPAYRKRSGTYYRIDENFCMIVETVGWAGIQRALNDLCTPWEGQSEDCTALEFYTAYATVRTELNIAANVIDHQLIEA
jgi:hypothetical protein